MKAPVGPVSPCATMDETWQQIGRYRGRVYNPAHRQSLAPALAELATRLADGPCELLQGGRHQTFRLALACGGAAPIDTVVKRFGPQAAWKDRWDRIHGTKAARTYASAAFLVAHGIGATHPVAVLEQWRGRRLVASYFISRYLADTVSFKDVLLGHLDGHGTAQPLLATLRQVAAGVRRLHDAGCRHNDLGNQNILLCGGRGTTAAEPSVVFLDLNRARCGRPLTLLDRARDLSRVTLPGTLLDRFFAMYWQAEVPRLFRLAETGIRMAFAWHTLTRLLRHPWRELRYRRRLSGTAAAPQHAVYPHARDTWVWDADQEQPLDVVGSGAPWRHPLRLARGWNGRSADEAGKHRGGGLASHGSTRGLPGGAECWSVVRHPGTGVPREAAVLRSRGIQHVFMRVYAHERPDERRARLATAREWLGQGFTLSAALVQSRHTVLHPGDWERFGTEVLAELGAELQWVVVGHGIDDPHWGVWTRAEYRSLLAAIGPWARAWPRIRWAVPACIRLNGARHGSLLRRPPPDLPAHALAVQAGAAGLPRDADLLAADLHRLGARLARERPGTALILSGVPDDEGNCSVVRMALATGYVRACIIG